jgi:Zn-dependent protease with chaperone function
VNPARYRRLAYTAGFALVSFVILYMGLCLAFIGQSLKLIQIGWAGGTYAWLAWLGLVPSLLVTIILIKGLFFRISSDTKPYIEIQAGDEPLLFAFIHRVADDAQAPRPYRVFLANEVNAAVAMEVSLLDLIVARRKNLVIGLPLLNTLNLSEFKAVLAHEFGHFSQRATAIGAWTYIAGHVVSRLLHSRGAIDRFLKRLAHLDASTLIGSWLLRTVVWSLRSALETAFGAVIWAERRLSRELEFQADSVSVNLCGSDALVHALHTLHGTDVAWDEVLAAANALVAENRRPNDLYAMHRVALVRLREILGDSDFGRAPDQSEGARGECRIFPDSLALPPRMWATHPSNRSREDHAKTPYIACAQDGRSPWELLRDAPARQIQLSQHAFRHASFPSPDAVEYLESETCMHVMAERYAPIFLEAKYRGTYLRRSCVRHADKPEALYLPATTDEATLDQLYPTELSRTLANWRALCAEVEMLEALKLGLIAPTRSDLLHRGRPLRRSELPQLLAAAKRDRDAYAAALAHHDWTCRRAHLDAAARISPQWATYLQSLIHLLHFADHTEAELRDAAGHYANRMEVVTADGRVNWLERRRLAKAALEIYYAIQDTWTFVQDVDLPDEIAKALETTQLHRLLPNASTLTRPEARNIASFAGFIDVWIRAYVNVFDALEREALKTLLQNEAKIAAAAQNGLVLESAPSPGATPAHYATQIPGSARSRQHRLGPWDRFQLADGWMPSLARFAVASGVLSTTLWAGLWFDDVEIYVLNGFPRPIVVDIAQKSIEVPALASTSLRIPASAQLEVGARTNEGEVIEYFRTQADALQQKYIYNVAGAASMIEYDAGTWQKLGTRRWLGTTATKIFDARSAQQRVGHVTTSEVRGSHHMATDYAMLWSKNHDEQVDLVKTHLRWDIRESEQMPTWATLAARNELLHSAIAARLQRYPDEISTRWALLRFGSAQDWHELCDEHIQPPGTNPRFDSTVEQWLLHALCLVPSHKSRNTIIRLQNRSPNNPWINLLAAEVLMANQQWREAADVLRMHLNQIPHTTEACVFLARITRISETERRAEIEQCSARSLFLREALQLEQHHPKNEARPQILAALSQSLVDKAWSIYQEKMAEDPQTLLLIAASDGAPEAARRAADQVDGDGNHSLTLAWIGLALALRDQRDTTPWIESVRSHMAAHETASLDDLLAPAQMAALLPAEFANETTHLTLETRLNFYAFASIVLGKSTPRMWKHASMRGLFAMERPAFDLELSDAPLEPHPDETMSSAAKARKPGKRRH